MLSKKERLSRQEFNRFFSMGKRFHSPSLTLIYTPHTTLYGSAVIGKKVAKTAVARNKFRRRIYDVHGRLKRECGHTGVFICIAKQGAGGVPYTQLKEELIGLIRKTGAIR